MEGINLRLPKLAKENIKDMDTDLLKNVDTGILLDHAQKKAEQLRYSGLDKKISIRREFKR
ncbi:MAG: hypothetical protein ACLFTR_00350 [Candidatus Woesearchaeota archaeon]